MAKFSPELNPQPEPPAYLISIVTGSGTKQTGRETVEIVTPGGVIEVNLKKHTVKMKYPEKGIPGGWAAAKALGAAITTWRESRDVKGLKELNAQAEKMLICSVEALLKVAARERVAR